MSYSLIDASRDDGEPIQLFEWSYQSTTWRENTSAKDYNDGVNVWSAAVISPFDRQEVSSNVNETPIKVTVGLQHPVAELFRTTALESSITLNIYEGHVSDGDFLLIHSGRVLRRKVKADKKKRQAVLTSEPLITSTKRPVLKEVYGINCNYVLYDPNTCKATKSGIVGIISSLSGLDLVVSNADSVADGELISGYIETSTEKRMITAHTGTSISVTTQMQGASIGDSVVMYIGCDHTTTACDALHGNILNFGAEPYIVEKNPFDGGLL